MAHDLVIRGGTVVDGTGAPARRADVAIDGDRIVEVGRPGRGRGAREIDADGLVVTPGLRRHPHPLRRADRLGPAGDVVVLARRDLDRDGQLRHDLRPVQAADREYLAELHGVGRGHPDPVDRRRPRRGTGRPTASTSASLDRLPKGLNVGGMVGHGALRWWAMGERSLEEGAAPTADELAEMERLLDEGVDAGALGFSTSRTLRHRVPDGRFVPGHLGRDPRAARARLGARSSAAAAWSRRAPRFDGDGPVAAAGAQSEIAWMREVSIADRPAGHLQPHPHLREPRALPAGHRARSRPPTPTAPASDRRPRRGASACCSRSAADAVRPPPVAGGASATSPSPHRQLAALRDPARRAELIAEADAGPGARASSRASS